MEYGLITNGIEISDKLKKALCRAKWVKFSLHSSNAEKYFFLTGTDSFEKVITNIKSFIKDKSQDTSVSVGCVVNKFNQSDEDIWDFYYNATYNLGVDHVRFGAYIGDIEKLKITREQNSYREISRKIKYDSSLNNVFTNIDSFIQDIEVERIYKSGSCPIVKAGLNCLINDLGDVYQCLRLAVNSKPIGSIVHNSFQEIMQNSTRCNMIEGCSPCRYKTVFPIIENIPKLTNSELDLLKRQSQEEDPHWKFQ
jgi:sulfatase maturation enzyme AslB (radical SAM superfamily)